MYYVYRITCTHPDSHEKYYYGYRDSKNKLPSNDNYWSSSKYIKEAIEKYGKEFFNKKIISIYNEKNAALSKEIKLHEKFNVDKNSLFFNKSKASIWGYNCTGSVVAGKTYEEIHGKKKAKELRKVRSKDMIKYRQKNDVIGKNNPNYGNKWSLKQKQKMSLRQRGKNHTQFGYFWINNGIIDKKMPPDSKIPIGWKKGRYTSPNKGIPAERFVCPHCKKEIGGKANYERWHNNNCKFKK